MRGTHIFTFNEHYQATREVFPTQKVPGAHQLEISDTFYDGFYGFGLGITPSSCYHLSQMDPSERSALLRHLYTQEGLSLQVGRICIGSCDYAPEIYTYDDVPDDFTLTHFSVARDEKYIIPIIKEILSINPNLYLLASPWSPPHWMKTGGSICGGYMREEFIECYTEYILKFIRAYEEYGIHISAITPQNEPETHKYGQMPTCIWHPDTEAKFICLLKKKFVENSLDIKILMYDHNFNGVDRVMWSLKTHDALLKSCDGVSFHYYEGAIEQTRILSKEYPSLELHFTEGGPRLTQNYDTDWVKWGLMIVKALKCGYRSFMGFNILLDEMGGPNVGPHIGICGGFITKNSQSGVLSYSGQYKAYSHISSYVRPTSKIHTIKTGDDFNICISDYPRYDIPIEGVLIDNGEEKVAVLVNPNACGYQTQMQIGGEYWYIELQADSISTVIIK